MKVRFVLFILLNKVFIILCGLLDVGILKGHFPVTKDQFKFSRVTCLPCSLNICPGSTNIPVSEDACGLATGIGSSAPVEREDCFPAWMNITKFKIGQNFGRKHRGKIGLLELFALVGLLAVPELRDVLLFTATNACPMQYGKRYASTTGQILLWAAADISLPGNPCVILNSLNQVRNVHKHVQERVRRVAKSKGDIGKLNSEIVKNNPVNDIFWDALKQDMEAAYTQEQLAFDPCYLEMQANTNNTLLNQFGYTVTLWSQLAISSMSKERALLSGAKDEDIDAFQHMWSVLGHVMGIKDKYNIALQPDSSRKAMYENFTIQYIVPALYHMKHETKVMVGISQKRAFNSTFFGINLPSPTPVEFFGLGLLRFILNIPYKNSYDVSSNNVRMIFDALNEQIATGNPPASSMDSQLNDAADQQVAYWGNKYFGPCYNSWVTNCQKADKLHTWYSGPDFNPNGTRSSNSNSKGYCENYPRFSMSC